MSRDAVLLVNIESESLAQVLRMRTDKWALKKQWKKEKVTINIQYNKLIMS